MTTRPDDLVATQNESQGFIGEKIIMHSMTKREAFAMAAMQGILSCPKSINLTSQSTGIKLSTESNTVGDLAVAFADSLIESLNKDLK